jgi:hypothetical protein
MVASRTGLTAMRFPSCVLRAALRIILVGAGAGTGLTAATKEPAAEPAVVAWEVGPDKPLLPDARMPRFKGACCTVRTTGPAAVANDVGKMLDAHLKVFRSFFTGPFRDKSEVQVVVFSSRAEYDAYLSSKGQAKAVRNAMYNPSLHESLIALEGDGTTRMLPLEVVKHEVTHHVLHLYMGDDDLPPWLDEGVACFFQYWNTADSSAVNVEQNRERATRGDFGYFPAQMAETWKTPAFVAPDKLLALDFKSFHVADNTTERLHYSESWALVNWLLSTRPGNQFLNVFIDQMRKGKPRAAIIDAGTMTRLQQEWYRDIEKRMLAKDE